MSKKLESLRFFRFWPFLGMLNGSLCWPAPPPVPTPNEGFPSYSELIEKMKVGVEKQRREDNERRIIQKKRDEEFKKEAVNKISPETQKYREERDKFQATIKVNPAFEAESKAQSDKLAKELRSKKPKAAPQPKQKKPNERGAPDDDDSSSSISTGDDDSPGIDPSQFQKLQFKDPPKK